MARSLPPNGGSIITLIPPYLSLPVPSLRLSVVSTNEYNVHRNMYSQVTYNIDISKTDVIQETGAYHRIQIMEEWQTNIEQCTWTGEVDKEGGILATRKKRGGVGWYQC